jgi:hypothetical protein
MVLETRNRTEKSKTNEFRTWQANTVSNCPEERIGSLLFAQDFSGNTAAMQVRSLVLLAISRKTSLDFVGQWDEGKGGYKYLKLAEAAERFGLVEFAFHNAAADALATWQVVQKMSEGRPNE